MNILRETKKYINLADPGGLEPANKPGKYICPFVELQVQKFSSFSVGKISKLKCSSPRAGPSHLDMCLDTPPHHTRTNPVVVRSPCWGYWQPMVLAWNNWSILSACTYKSPPVGVIGGLAWDN